jgi:hypothetical protein
MQSIELSEPVPVAVFDGDSFSFDARDPLARFLQDRLHLNWLELFFLALLIYGPVEKLIIPAMGGYLDLMSSIRQWTPHVEALLTGFVEFPFFLAFYLWTGRGIARMFMSLRHNNSFARPERYLTFMQQAQAVFNQSRWSFISVALAVFVMLLMHFVVWGPDSVVPPWFGDRLYARLLALVLIGLVAYAIAQTLIREILTILWLHRLWAGFGDDLVLHPYHSDDAGGLGAIGQHIAFFFYFVMMLMLFIIMATILPSWLEVSSATREATLQLQVRFWSPVIIIIWILYLLIIPFMFFLLVWPPHRAMCNLRNAHLNQISQQLDEQLQATAANVVKDHSALPTILDEIKHLKNVRTIFREDFPTWPISRETRQLFGLTSLLPTAYSLLTVIVGYLL